MIPESKPDSNWLTVWLQTEVYPMPAQWPPPGPFWRTRSKPSNFTLIVCVRDMAEIDIYWPDARTMILEEGPITFNDEFSCPECWDPVTETFAPGPPPPPETFNVPNEDDEYEDEEEYDHYHDNKEHTVVAVNSWLTRLPYRSNVPMLKACLILLLTPLWVLLFMSAPLLCTYYKELPAAVLFALWSTAVVALYRAIGAAEARDQKQRSIIGVNEYLVMRARADGFARHIQPPLTRDEIVSKLAEDPEHKENKQ